MTALPQPSRSPQAAETADAYAGWLTVAEAARRLGCSPGHVRRRCTERWAKVSMAVRVGGEWWICPDVDRRLSEAVGAPLMIRSDFKALPPAQQTAAMQRAECVRRFRRAKSDRPGRVSDWLPGLLAELNRAYAGLKVSRTSLYRWDKQAGDPIDVAELVDWRGWANSDRGGAGSPSAWQYFASQYLDSARTTLRECWRRTKLWAAERGEDWCSIDACRRQLDQRIPKERQVYHRDKKQWKSAYAPYIEQHPERHPAGDCWVADHRPLDLLCRHEGKTCRPIITAIQDWRTRKIVGWSLSSAPNTDTILAALGMAIKDPSNLGPPALFWMDNGKDFESIALIGISKQERARGTVRFEADEDWFGGVMGALGIEPHFSLKNNPQGKARCERWFATLGSQFDKRWQTYTGKDTVSKPHDLDERMRLHADRITPDFAQVHAAIVEFIAGYNANADHQIDDLVDPETRRRLSPDEAYAAWTTPRVLADPSALDLCLMPHTKPVTVTRNGVRLALPDCPPRYFGQFDEQLMQLKGTGRRVRIYYDPADLRQVHVRDERGRLVCVADLNDNTGVHDAPESRDALKAVSRAKRNYEKGVRMTRENADALMPAEWLIAGEAAKQAAARAPQPPIEPDPNRPMRLIQTAFDGQSEEVQRHRAKQAARKAVGDSMPHAPGGFDYSAPAPGSPGGGEPAGPPRSGGGFSYGADAARFGASGGEDDEW